jgi:hypothetical protein
MYIFKGLVLALLFMTVAQARTVLTSPITFYIAPASCNTSQGYWPDNRATVTACGNDASIVGSQGAPFATPQHAADWVMQNYDVNCQAVSFQLAAAFAGDPQYVYPKGYNVSGRFVGQCGSFPPLYLNATGAYIIGHPAPVMLAGDINNVTGAFIYPSPGNGSGITLTEGASLRAQGLTIDTSNTFLSGVTPYQDCIDVMANSFLDVSYIWFGNAGQGAAGSQLHFGVAFQSTLLISGPTWISGSAYSHYQVGQQSTVYYNNNGDPSHQLNVTIMGTPSFPQGWAYADGSQVIAASVHYTGTFHGPLYGLARMGMIEVGGATKGTFSNPRPCVNPFPGDQAPTQINGMCE